MIDLLRFRLITDNSEKKSVVNETTQSNGKINEQNKQNDQRHDSQKNLLIDLSNDTKPTGNSWVRDET